MYLARELQKAEIALKTGLDYEQDGELNLRKIKREKNRLMNTVGLIKSNV